MFCKKCGKKIRDDISFCPHCGQKVTIPQVDRQEKAAETPVRILPVEKSAAAEPVRIKQDEEEQISRGAGSKSLMPFIIIGILILIVVVLAFMLFRKQSDEEDSSQGYGLTTDAPEDMKEDTVEQPALEEEVQELDVVEETAEQEPVQEEQPSQYILPESNSAYLTREDLAGMTKEECRLARNELYARHGRRFDDEELQGYFDSCEWYSGTIAPADFDDSVLNEYEIANRDLIVMYEEERGYR